MNSLDMNPDGGDKTTPDEDDHTVMVARVATPQDSAPQDSTPQDSTPQDSAPDEDDHTVMVQRVATPQDSAPDEDDHTVVVGRTSNGAAKPQLDKPQLDKPSTSRRRSGLTPPPVPANFAPQAVEAVGPDATESYRPRAIPEPPPQAPVILQGPDATREASATMPSVARHARITARVAMVVFVTSCVASVVGLTLMALALF